MSSWFDDLADELDPTERDRLRRVHELLVDAGPPPELPASLESLPAGVGTTGTTIAFPRARRRAAAAIAIAAALAAAAFGGGYLVGDRGGSPSAAKPVRVAKMSGSNASATLRVDAPEAGGNWPVKFSVSGLPRQSGKYAYYEIFVISKGKLVYPCAGFRARAGATTTVTFNVPYRVTGKTRWVVTAVDKQHRWPGRIVMT